MYSTNSSAAFQVSNESNNGLLFIPSSLPGFTQSGVYSRIDASGNHSIYQCDGVLCEVTDEERICPVCGQKMHIKSSRSITLRHLPFGFTYIHVTVKVQRLFCENGHHTQMRSIPFRAQKHTITTALESYIEDLLASGCYTLKEIAERTGVEAHLVGEIDKARLSRLYTDQTELGPVLKKPDTCSRYLAIDEFKLHNGHKYATHIIDLETGHVLWIARGK